MKIKKRDLIPTALVGLLAAYLLLPSDDNNDSQTLLNNNSQPIPNNSSADPYKPITTNIGSKGSNPTPVPILTTGGADAPASETEKKNIGPLQTDTLWQS